MHYSPENSSKARSQTWCYMAKYSFSV